MSTKRTGSERPSASGRPSSSTTRHSSSLRTSTPGIGDVVTGQVVGIGYMTPVYPAFRFVADTSSRGGSTSSHAIEGSTSSSRAVSNCPTESPRSGSSSRSSHPSTPTATRTVVTTETLETSEGKISRQFMTREQIDSNGKVSGSFARVTSADIPGSTLSRLREPGGGFSATAQRLLTGTNIPGIVGASRGQQTSSQSRTITQGGSGSSRTQAHESGSSRTVMQATSSGSVRTVTQGTSSGSVRTVTQGGSGSSRSQAPESGSSRAGTHRSVQPSQSQHTARSTEHRSTQPASVAASRSSYVC